MKKWEYFTYVETNKIVDLPSILKPLGLEGWELVTQNNVLTKNGGNMILVFKRPLKEQETHDE